MRKGILSAAVSCMLALPVASGAGTAWSGWESDHQEKYGEREECASTQGGWQVPGSVRIVQQDGTDDTRVLPTIGAALASLPGTALPCGETRYLVKIMPGVYIENVVLPPCVDLEGSGQENTVIRASVEEDGSFSSPAKAVLVITGDSSVSSLSVVNSGVTSGYAIVFSGSGKARNVSATVESESGVLGGIGGIFAWGKDTVVSLDHVEVRSTTVGMEGDVLGVGSSAASLSLKDSKVSAVGGSWAVAVFGAGTDEGVLDIRDSVLEAEGSPSSSALERRHGVATVRVAGTRMRTANCGTGCTAVLGVPGTVTELLQSDLVGSVYAARVLASRIDGDIGPFVTLTGCWDADFSPIPDNRP